MPEDLISRPITELAPLLQSKQISPVELFDEVLNRIHQLQPKLNSFITVTEAEIRAAMRAIVATTRLVPEPSGAVAAAALLFHGAELPPYSRAVAALSGGNVDPALLAEVLAEA